MTLPRPLPGTTLDALVKGLQAAAVTAGNAHNSSAGRSWNEVRSGYVNWTLETERALRQLLRPADLTALLHTPRQWAIHNMTTDNPSLLPLIFFELDERKRELEETAKALQAERDRWRWRQVLVVPDTNVLLHNLLPFEQIDWRAVARTKAEPNVVIPLVVVNELDRLKRTGKEAAKTRARHTLRTLNALLLDDPGEPVRLADDPRSPLVEVLVDDLEHVRLPDPDPEIVDRALYLKEVSGKEVRLISDDQAMQFRARTAGLLTYPSYSEENRTQSEN